MQKKTLSNFDISSCLNTIEENLIKYQYESVEVKRYTLLTEEVLLRWKEVLGEDAISEFNVQENRKDINFVFKVKGKRSYPFEHKDGNKEFLAHMHDRLLEGTGCEFKYYYFAGTNKLILSMPKNNHEENLFYKNMIALALPVAFQFLLTTIITATDSILMGLIDQASLSAISMTEALIDLFNILITALVTGTTIYASQCWGKRDHEGIGHIFKVSLMFSGLVSFLFFLPTFACPKLVMSLYTDIPELIEKGALYLRLVSPMFLCSGFFQIYYAIMKNTGKVTRFAIYMVIATIVDFGLNIILVFGYLGFPALGIKGAAIGTVVASFVQLLLCFIDSLSSNEVHLFRKNTTNGLKPLEYLKKCGSVGAQMISWTLANNIVISIFGHMGSDVVAASGVVNIISEMGIFACAGIYNTCGILVGNKLGNDKLEEGKTYSLRYFKASNIVGIFTCAGILLLNCNIRILPFNISDKAFDFLHIMLYVVAFELWFKSMNCTMNNAGFYAGGDTVPLLIIDTVNMWLIMVPLGLLCLYVFKLPPIVVAVLLHFDEFTSFPFKYSRYMKFKWARNINAREA